MGHRKNTNPSLFIQLAKVHKMTEKKMPGYENVEAEYLTGQINSLILQLLLR